MRRDSVNTIGRLDGYDTSGNVPVEIEIHGFCWKDRYSTCVGSDDAANCGWCGLGLIPKAKQNVMPPASE
jgi:hypothetical protein